jgi:hypothetical protein
VSAIFDCTTVNPLCERLHQQSQVFPHPAASSQSKDRLSFHAVVAESKDAGLRMIPFAQDSLIAICSTKHPLAARRSVSLELLA